MASLVAPGHRFRRESRPVGLPTRGFTAPNRLRKTDTYLLLAHAAALRDGLTVDLGFGASPVTTIELARRISRVAPGASVLGVEIDPARVAAAQPYERPGLAFRTGGFNLPLESGERVTVVRAMNVLRQYSEADVAAALGHLARSVAPGAVVLEGTCNPTGRLTTFNVFERAGSSANPVLELRALVFAAVPQRDFAPREFQAVLPKTLIHHAEPGGDLDTFFANWEAAQRSLAPLPLTPRRRAQEVADRLAFAGYPVYRHRSLARRGYLVLRGPEPIRRIEPAANN